MRSKPYIRRHKYNNVILFQIQERYQPFQQPYLKILHQRERNNQIRFRKANIGGHYSPNTGVFTVPKPGLYMLSATVRSAGGKQLHCALWVNDVMHVGLFGTNYSTGSLNTVLQLKKGQRVYIKKDPRSGELMLGRHRSMFSGYLIA
jgi:hypothetical protein